MLCPLFQMVRLREGPQHPSDGPAGSITGGPLQLLLAPVHHQDCAHASRFVLLLLIFVNNLLLLYKLIQQIGFQPL